MPGRPHRSDKMRKCVDEVMAKGHDESSAYAICTASLQQAGEPIFASDAEVGGISTSALEAAGRRIAEGTLHLGDWNEADHPRDKDGKFASSGSGSSASSGEESSLMGELKTVIGKDLVREGTPALDRIRGAKTAAERKDAEAELRDVIGKDAMREAQTIIDRIWSPSQGSHSPMSPVLAHMIKEDPNGEFAKLLKATGLFDDHEVTAMQEAASTVDTSPEARAAHVRPTLQSAEFQKLVHVAGLDDPSSPSEHPHAVGSTVLVPHKGQMVVGEVIRHPKTDPHGVPHNIVDVGEYGSISVPVEKTKPADLLELVKNEAQFEKSGDIVKQRHAQAQIARYEKLRDRKPWQSHKTIKALSARTLEAAGRRIAEGTLHLGDWNEADHPRDQDGKFASSGSSSVSSGRDDSGKFMDGMSQAHKHDIAAVASYVANKLTEEGRHAEAKDAHARAAVLHRAAGNPAQVEHHTKMAGGGDDPHQWSKEHFADYKEAAGVARARANSTGNDVAIRKASKYDTPGFIVRFASKNDSDYARAEIVKPER